MKNGHGGNIWKLAAEAGIAPHDILDFSANINPLGPPPWLSELVGKTLADVVHYPEPDAAALVAALSRFHGVAPEEIVAGNGSTELLYALPRALRAARAVIPVPAYVDYAAAARLNGMEVELLPLKEDAGFAPDAPALRERLRRGELVLLGQPNNPTGLLFDPDALRWLARERPATTFAVDEAFADFVAGYETLIGDRPDNVVVLRSMTKFYAIPGLRLGYAAAARDTAERLRRFVLPWSVNVFAQAVGVRALEDEDYACRTRRYVSEQRERLRGRLEAMPGLTVYPGRANFLLLRLDRRDILAPELARRLLLDGIAIRVCANYDGLDERFFRVAVRTPEENDRLCVALEGALGQTA